MVGRIINNHADIAEGLDWLCTVEPRFQKAAEACPEPPLRRRKDGFAELLSAITSQQLSVASASAIWARMEAAGMIEPKAILSASDEDLRACGFSRQKILYARDLAASGINYRKLRETPTDKVIAQLVAVRGIGSWTAEVYAMFSLGRADVFAPGDLALQESARVLFDLPDRPKEKAFREMAQAWSPWRSVAARLLWDYYHVLKNKEGIR